ncbi:hypothetical protein M8494_20245 [Serratia ureilytica]
MKRIEVYHHGRCHHRDYREPLRLSARQTSPITRPTFMAWPPPIRRR